MFMCVCVCLKRKVQAQMLHTIGGKKISYENVQRPSSPHTQSLSRQPCEYWHEFFFSLCRQHTQTHIAPGLIFGKQPPPSSSLSLSPVRADGCGIRAQQKREKIYTSLCVLHRVFGASDKRPGAVKNPVYHVSHLLNKNIAHALHINSLTLLAWGNRILLYCAPTSMNEQQMRLRARFSLSITYTGMYTHTPASCALIVSVCTRKMALAPQFSQKKISIIPALIPIVWIDWQTYKCACEMNWETATNQTRINSVSGV